MLSSASYKEQNMITLIIANSIQMYLKTCP